MEHTKFEKMIMGAAISEKDRAKYWPLLELDEKRNSIPLQIPEKLVEITKSLFEPLG